ncbi:hypothetical protein DUT91_21200 [Phyllobacterium salinisoli]|uniref:Uncharacterized protein n=1 Tax=Phyllobacterium salinisoli TaxID=1899321 RepID=A0A368JXR4_9HYPH|nr:hypothetical protein DUT91_21200 [Phyllobacterium salinisoli]
MAVVTAAALLALLASLWNGRDEILVIALWIIVIGAAATALRRAAKRLSIGRRSVMGFDPRPRVRGDLRTSSLLSAMWSDRKCDFGRHEPFEAHKCHRRAVFQMQKIRITDRL